MAMTMNEIYEEILKNGGMTPSKKIKDTSIRFPNKIAMRYKEFGVWQETTYEDFWKKSNYLSLGLKFFGIQKGDSVAIHSENRPEWFIADIGIQSIGAVSVGLYPTNPSSEVEYLLSHSETKILFAEDQEQVDKALEVIDQLPQLEKIIYFEDRGLYSYDHPKLMRFDEFLNLGKSEYESFPEYVDQQLDNLEDDDVAFLVYTSGTTGKSKGAMLTQANLLSNGNTLMYEWQFSKNSVLLHALPLFHTHGLFVATNVMLAAGGGMVFLPKFNLDEIIKNLPKCSAMMGVPTFYTRLIADDRFNKKFVNHMRLFVSGSAPLLSETHIQFEKITGHRILERYGMTETNMNTSNPYKGERRAGTVGHPLPGVDLKITDPETGKELSTDQIGQIEVRGPNVFKGYWKMPEKTKAELRENGFFITGDLGKIDEDGYVHILGRDKDLIISGGYNIYPKELEEILDNQVGVLESAVIGVPHTDFGETPIAVIVQEAEMAPDLGVINSNLSRSLARYKHPKKIIIVDELPRNTMGKVQKNVLRNNYKALFVS